MNKMAKNVKGFFYGASPYQDHHGGGLWLKDDEGWFVVRNVAGIEWSAQFCADPAKIDALRVNAKRLYARFPEAAKELKIQKLLDTPITDAAGVAAWTDSICNASVALPALLHTGVLPKAGGIHHYPAPVAEIALFKYDDFNLWVTDEAGKPTAVAPVGERGSGDGRVQVVFAEEGSASAEKQKRAWKRGRPAVLQKDDTIAQKAFADQYLKLAQDSVPESDPLSNARL
jgi:hypothetical protein